MPTKGNKFSTNRIIQNDDGEMYVQQATILMSASIGEAKRTADDLIPLAFMAAVADGDLIVAIRMEEIWFDRVDK